MSEENNTNREPMVTIPLKEYNLLRDKSNNSMIIFERMAGIDSMIRDLNNRAHDLEQKR